MEPLVAASFALGLASGVHCAGMCGGIVVAFSAQPLLPRAALWRRQLALQLGRISTYALLGAAAAATGAVATAFPAQQALFVLANLALVLIGLQLAGFAIGTSRNPGMALWRHVQPFAASLMRTNPFVAGMAWGLLPCGLVYAALALAMLAGGAAQGAAAMLGFGAGTLPWLLAAGVAAARLRRWVAGAAGRVAAGAMVSGFGVWGLAHASAPAQSLRAWLCL